MSVIREGETEIVCRWEERDGTTVRSEGCERIDKLLRSGRMVPVTDARVGWSPLLRHRVDGRYWKLSYPQADLYGAPVLTLTECSSRS